MPSAFLPERILRPGIPHWEEDPHRRSVKDFEYQVRTMKTALNQQLGIKVIGDSHTHPVDDRVLISVATEEVQDVGFRVRGIGAQLQSPAARMARDALEPERKLASINVGYKSSSWAFRAANSIPSTG